MISNFKGEIMNDIVFWSNYENENENKLSNIYIYVKFICNY